MTENKDKIVDRDKEQKSSDLDQSGDQEAGTSSSCGLAISDKENEKDKEQHDRSANKDEFGTQRVYKKTSPNNILTLYLPTREITLTGNNPAILNGIVYVDPEAIQGYRVYAQLTLTFRYGREDEEVMGLRFCNEAIMSLHQIWPRKEDPSKDDLSPLQEALLRRLGDGAHPFTLSLTTQAPPSVQLVPAKRYYGAPIGTSYDVRCFIADKTDEKFTRRTTVKMGVRVIYRTDVFHHNNVPENFTALVNNQTTSPPVSANTNTVTTTTSTSQSTPAIVTTNSSSTTTTTNRLASSNENKLSETHIVGPSCSSAPPTTTHPTHHHHHHPCTGGAPSHSSSSSHSSKTTRKSERGDSFPKLRLSPKSFRFSGRFGRSKSEVEKCPNDPIYNYSKSFQEYDNSTGGPQGAVDKPFLLQDGRVGLKASLDKAWYTHGEDVSVTINIKNDSRKTVRKVRVCAIQHVDVCMFNNGKFKNVVADTDNQSPIDRTVPPGCTLITTVVLKPQRGPTKNWIALEDTLQRSTEPDEITGLIAASAIKSPHIILPLLGQQQNQCGSPAIAVPSVSIGTHGSCNDDRNVFAIYVSYYVKVKLTLSGMGGELSLKLPFVLVHIDESQRNRVQTPATNPNEMPMEKLALHDVPKRNGNRPRSSLEETTEPIEQDRQSLDRIESLDEDANIKVQVPNTLTRAGSNKRRLLRSETLAKDLDEDTDDNEHGDENRVKAEVIIHRHELNELQTIPEQKDSLKDSVDKETDQIHIVQVHSQNTEELLIQENPKSDSPKKEKNKENDEAKGREKSEGASSTTKDEESESKSGETSSSDQ